MRQGARGGRGGDIIKALKSYAALDDPAPAPPPPDTGAGDKVPQDQIEGGVRSASESKSEAKRKPLIERLGDDFARGHVQASGGIVNVDEFEELMRLMRIGEKKSDAERKRDDEAKGREKDAAKKEKERDKKIDPGQKNTLMGYFGKTKAQTGKV